MVFQHWKARYFEVILEEATEAGASLRAAATQVGDTIWSMHKKKNKEKVLAGELILTFLKDGAHQARGSGRLSPATIERLIDKALVEVSPGGRPFAGKLLFLQVILKAWKRGLSVAWM